MGFNLINEMYYTFSTDIKESLSDITLIELTFNIHYRINAYKIKTSSHWNIYKQHLYMAQ